MYHVIVISSGK